MIRLLLNNNESTLFPCFTFIPKQVGDYLKKGLVFRGYISSLRKTSSEIHSKHFRPKTQPFRASAWSVFCLNERISLKGFLHSCILYLNGREVCGKVRSLSVCGKPFMIES